MFTKDVDYHLGAPAEVLSQTRPGLPIHWARYLDPNRTSRLANLQADIMPLAKPMPKTFGSLNTRVRDAFLVKDKDNVIRVLNKQIEDSDNLYSYMSNVPVQDSERSSAHPRFFSNAPKAFQDLYLRSFDGLFDASMSGIMPLSQMRPLSDVVAEYEEYPWYDQLSSMSRLEDIIQIFSSGGGGYIYLDLRVDQRDLRNPICMLLMNEADEPPDVSLDFWEYLDAWTSIAMGE